jgi:hypothetical protein
MIRLKSLLLFAVLLLVLPVLPLLADAPKYQRSTEVTLRGEVLYVGDDASATVGAYVIMKDGNNEIQVYLAPHSFLDAQGIELRAGASIAVIGSRTQWGGGEIILARQLTKGSKTVTLRTADGAPQW